MQSLWLVCLAAILLFVPEAVSASLVPVACSGPGAPLTCGTCEFVALINNVIQFIILLASFIAVIAFLFAGFLYLTSGGNSSQAQQANKLFTNVVIGFTLILASFLIIDFVVKSLVDQRSPLYNWSAVQCIYPTKPTASEFSEPAFTVAGGGSCDITTGAGGPCSVANLEKAGFSAGAALQARQICSTESSFNAAAVSSLDNIENSDLGYSIGLFQINLSMHELTCNGETLDCKSAFVDTGKLNKQGVRIKRLVNGKEELFNRCRAAAAKPECNIAKAKELYDRSGDFGDWACSAKKCGIGTSRNNLCPLNF